MAGESGAAGRKTPANEAGVAGETVTAREAGAVRDEDAVMDRWNNAWKKIKAG